jgi:hypothetical protein
MGLDGRQSHPYYHHTTAAAVTSTMQIVEQHVKYNTTTNQTHLKQTTIVVGVRVNLKKRVTIIVTSTI